MLYKIDENENIEKEWNSNEYTNAEEEDSKKEDEKDINLNILGLKSNEKRPISKNNDQNIIEVDGI